MSVSLIYICCSFRGGILSVVFPTVAICFWPAGNLECPCLFSDLILFPFLLLFFYIVPYRSFSSMSFSLIYICCSLILFPFLLLFCYIVPCLFHWSISAVVSGEAFYLLFFPTVAICFWPAGNLECPLSLFRPYPLPFSPPFLLYCSLPFLFFYVFFIDLYLLLFPGRHSICCFPQCSHMFLTRREPGVPLSLFRSYPLPFSPPFLLYCSLPFLFFYVFFIDLFCCSLREAFYLLFSAL